METTEKGGKEEMIFYLVAAFMIGGAFGALGMAIIASGNYQKGYEDGLTNGYDEARKDDEWMLTLLRGEE